MPESKIKLDELELYYNILQGEEEYNLNLMTSAEISDLISKRFGVITCERDVFLLHEPSIEEDILDISIHYSNLFNT